MIGMFDGCSPNLSLICSNELIKKEYKKKEIENTFLDIDDNVSKISIIIDYQMKSFSKLFYYCFSVESIEFKKFYRNNVTDMSDQRMFIFKRIKS